MALNTKDFRELIKFIEKKDDYDIMKFEDYTNLEFYSDIFSKIGKFWYISSNNDDIIVVEPTLLSEEYDIWNKRNHSLKCPYRITKQWLKSIIYISDSVKRRYPKLNEKLIANQLYKYCNRFDFIPLKGINIYDNKDWVDIYNKFSDINTEIEKDENCMGFSNIKNGNAYVNIDSDYSLWGLLCHEIRHIGLECNPIYYNITEKEREEDSVLEYGKLCGLSFDWDDSWMD